MRLKQQLGFVALLVMAVAVAGCGSLGATPTPSTYTDPFAYCAAVGTADEPGATYVGEAIPESVALALRVALNASDTPLDMLARGSVWRCMDGKVYGCFVGANLPCGEKADTSREPNDEMTAFCAENQNSDFIPAYVTGRATVYEWRCTSGAPEVVRQLDEPDGQGFLKSFWYELPQQ